MQTIFHKSVIAVLLLKQHLDPAQVLCPGVFHWFMCFRYLYVCPVNPNQQGKKIIEIQIISDRIRSVFLMHTLLNGFAVSSVNV